MASSGLDERVRGVLENIRMKRTQKMKIHPHTIVVTLESADHINAGAAFFTNYSNPYVILNTITGGPSGLCIAVTKSKVLRNTLSPKWDEELDICMKGTGHLVLTVMNRNMIISDNFLGQV